MDNLFFLKLFLSFIIGGLYIAVSLRIAEKFGSRIGGVLLGLPTTLIVSLLFIAWSQDVSAAVSASVIVPAAIAASSLFLVFFIYFLKFGRIRALVYSILGWLMLTFPLALFSIRSILLSLLVAIIFFAIAVLFFKNYPNRKLEKTHLAHREFLFRIISTGTLVAAAVFLGKIAGPVWGGLLASFPVAFSSSLMILLQKHGIDFTSSVAKTMPFGGIGSLLFVILFYILVPIIGLASGIIIAYITCIIFGLIIGTMNQKRIQ